jgi:hypothetical protein
MQQLRNHALHLKCKKPEQYIITSLELSVSLISLIAITAVVVLRSKAVRAGE